eukprot:4783436-Alexandrium_andersonii.AAC.1
MSKCQHATFNTQPLKRNTQNATKTRFRRPKPLMCASRKLRKPRTQRFRSSENSELRERELRELGTPTEAA